MAYRPQSFDALVFVENDDLPNNWAEVLRAKEPTAVNVMLMSYLPVQLLTGLLVGRHGLDYMSYPFYGQKGEVLDCSYSYRHPNGLVFWYTYPTRDNVEM